MTDYTAFEIDAASRERILGMFPAKYPDVVAHHITHKYGATAADLPPPPRNVEIVGYHDSGAIQVLVAEVDGRKHQASLDDDGHRKFYHITLSLDRAAGVSPRNANDVLQAIVSAKGEEALANLPEPLRIEVQPKLLADSGGNPKPKSSPPAPPRL